MTKLLRFGKHLYTVPTTKYECLKTSTIFNVHFASYPRTSRSRLGAHVWVWDENLRIAEIRQRRDAGLSRRVGRYATVVHG